MYIRVNEPLMLTARNAQLAITAMYIRVGLPLKSISNGEPFCQGYDNYTGGAAGIGNFNALMNPSGALHTKIFYGCVTFGFTNDNIGVTNHTAYCRYYHDLPGFSYAFTLNVVKTLDAGVTFFSYELGTTTPIFVQQAGLTSKSQLAFDGYIFDITQ